ncbi:MAG: glycosyltransferase [Desulfovibrionaceae bacterium]|nr:glycosyltransferase [Desulfovibrionaceae bacterium]
MSDKIIIYDEIESIMAQGVLDKDHENDLFIQWDLIRNTNETLNSGSDIVEDCILIKERLFAIVDKIFSTPRSWYTFSFVSGEPTLHPFFLDLLEYICSQGKNVCFSLTTDGQNEASYYSKLFKILPEHSLELALRLPWAGQNLSLIQEAAEAKQRVSVLASSKTIDDALLKSLCTLRKSVPFSLTLPSDAKMPAAFEKACAEGPKALPPLPFGQPHCYHDQPYETPVATGNSDIDLLCQDFSCCVGANLLVIAPNGQFAPAYGYPMKKLGYWDAGEKTLAKLVKVVPYQDGLCSGPNAVIPKFKSREAALAWQSKCLERLAANKEGERKKRRMPQTEDIVRARLQRIAAKGASHPCPKDPKWVDQQFPALCTLYAKLKDTQSRDLLLSAFRSVETGEASYLPKPQALPKLPHIPGEVVFVDDASTEGIVIEPSETLDALVLKKRELCSRIVLSQENAFAVLEGSVRTLADYQPYLRVSTSNLKDLLTIPLWLLEHNPDYTLKLFRTGDETYTITADPKNEPIRHETAIDVPHPLFSIIIPVGDDDEELTRCVKSILCQDRTDLEIILVTSDTYSTGDDCVASFVRDNPRIVKSMRLEDSARSAVLNAGFTMALGTYCMVLEPKDMVAWEFLPKSCGYIQSDAPDILAFDRVFFTKDIFEHAGVEPGSYVGTESLDAFLSGKIGPWLGRESLRGKLFSREYLQNRRLRFPDLGENTDLAFALQAHGGSRTTLVVPEYACFTEKAEDDTDSFSVDDEPLKAYAAFAAWYARFCSEYGLNQEEAPFAQVLEQSFAAEREQILSSLTFDTDEEGLSDDLLKKLAGSKTLFCTLLKEYALLYCQKEALDPLPLEHLDWEREASDIASAPKYTLYSQDSSPTLPKLSVILTVHNAAEDLSRTMESIAAQYPDEESHEYECIVVDGNPEHIDILQAFADCDPCIRLATLESPADPQTCRSVALSLVRGQYVIFVDEGDICLPGSFAHAVAQIENTEADLVCLSYETVDSQNEVLSSREVTDNFYGEDHCVDFLADYAESLTCYGMIFDARALSQSNLGSPSFVTSFVQNAESIVCDPTKVYQHRESAEEPTKKASYAQLKDQYLVLSAQTSEPSEELVNPVLQNIATFWQVLGTVPVTEDDYKTLAANTHLLRFLVTSYAKLYEECDDEKGILSTPDISLLSYDVTTTIQPYVSLYQNECMSSEEEIAALREAPKLFGLFMQDYATHYCEDYRQVELSSFDDVTQGQGYEQADYLIPAPSNTSKECLLSILIVTRNSAETLDRCLESFTSETVDAIECIVVDDASDTDNSYLKSLEFQKKDARIRLFRTPWYTGAGQARNLGLSQAKGKWVLFLDPKDWLCKGFQTQCVPLLSRTKASLLDLSWKAYSEDKSQFMYSKTQTKSSEIDAQSAFAAWLKKSEASGLWSKIVRKDVLVDKSIQYFPQETADDFFLLIQLYTSVDTIVSSSLHAVYHVEESQEQEQSAYPNEQECQDAIDHIAAVHAYLLSKGYDKNSEEYQSILNTYVEGTLLDTILRYTYLDTKLPAHKSTLSFEPLLHSDAVIEKCIVHYKKLIRNELGELEEEE